MGRTNMGKSHPPILLFHPVDVYPKKMLAIFGLFRTINLVKLNPLLGPFGRCKYIDTDGMDTWKHLLC